LSPAATVAENPFKTNWTCCFVNPEVFTISLTKALKSISSSALFRLWSSMLQFSTYVPPNRVYHHCTPKRVKALTRYAPKWRSGELNTAAIVVAWASDE
jgi:hypothetical protein